MREALPPGWSLLTSLHLLGVDGQLLTTVQRGCKFEADMLVLDQQGVAVAIIEGESVVWPCWRFLPKREVLRVSKFRGLVNGPAQLLWVEGQEATPCMLHLQHRHACMTCLAHCYRLPD